MFLPLILVNLTWYHWVIIGVSIFLLSSLLFSIWLVFAIARRVYLHTLSNKMGEGWGRVCSAPNNPEQVKMWDEGIEFMSQYSKYKKEVSITNDGLKLMGELYDFGHKKTATFLCGRCECLIYAYYYAKPYLESGYNLLFVDPRGHGFSEGHYSTVGIKEGEDIVAWMNYIHNNFKQEKFVLHCVCVGGSAGTIAYNFKNGKELIEKIVFDGVFINFLESYKRHYVDLGHKKFPVFYLIWFWFKMYTGQSVKKASPLNNIKTIDIPVLFIHTKNDKYSLPENAVKVFDACPSKNKKLVWFTEGSHSHIRNNALEKYDKTIKDFLTVN